MKKFMILILVSFLGLSANAACDISKEIKKAEKIINNFAKKSGAADYIAGPSFRMDDTALWSMPFFFTDKNGANISGVIQIDEDSCEVFEPSW